MKVTRRGVFETNSSSTHSLTMVSEEDFEKWKKGELFFDTDNDELVMKDHVEALRKEDLPEDEDYDDDDYNDDGFQTYSEWKRDHDLETFEEYHTTPSGEKVVAFGKFGYNG